MAIKRPQMIVNGCPDCGNHMILKKSIHGKFYGCNQFPKCKASHGANQFTGEPLGIPADSETKKWRIKAHEEFDAIWKKGLLPSRGGAYNWLGRKMGIPGDEMHIGMMDIEQCKEIIEFVKYFDEADSIVQDILQQDDGIF